MQYNCCFTKEDKIFDFVLLDVGIIMLTSLLLFTEVLYNRYQGISYQHRH